MRALAKQKPFVRGRQSQAMDECLGLLHGKIVHVGGVIVA
jgi:hypothetical protein